MVNGSPSDEQLIAKTIGKLLRERDRLQRQIDLVEDRLRSLSPYRYADRATVRDLLFRLDAELGELDEGIDYLEGLL